MAEAQNVTLTITNNGANSGAVGVRPFGNVCNPGLAGGTCTFTYPVGSALRIMANSPSTPGVFNSGTGDAAACATSVCEFVINGNSSITATFNAGAHPSITFQLLGDGKGNVGNDNNQCQNFEFGFSSCTSFYAAGSQPLLQGRTMPGNIFAGFSGGTNNAIGCNGTADCTFTLTVNSSVNATFSALSSVAIMPGSATIGVGQMQSFSAVATFTNGMTRNGLGGNSPFWQNQVQMDVPRFSLAAAVVNDLLYAIGGVDGTCPSSPCAFGPLATVEAYNPLVNPNLQFSQVWTARASMTTPREGLAAAVVNGKIYALGGHTTGGGAVSSMEVFDPGTNAWSGAASMSAARAGMAAAVIGNTIYVVGGNAAAGGAPPIPLATVEAYNSVGNSWTTKASMLTARRDPAAAAVNGILYVIGGDGTGSVEAYDPVANSWSARAPMPADGGASHEAAALNGLIYAVGGPSNTMKVYNPAVDSWLTLGTMPTPQRGQYAMAVFDGRLFAAGGIRTDQTVVGTFSSNRPPETTWWSSNSAVASIVSNNNGNVNGVSEGTATISARLVGIDSGAQSATLTVDDGGGGGGGCSAPVISNITVIGTVPFDRVQVQVFDGVTNDLLFEGELPLGFFDDAELPEGQYRIEFSVPAGYMVTPSTFNVDAVCDEPVNLNATVQAIPAGPPTITVPADITVDATGPQGAVVNYSASATSAGGGSVPVSCTPPPGTFPIGTTTVTCTATDAGGTATESFTVLVQAAAAQVSQLITTVETFNLQQGISNSLDAKLEHILIGLSSATTGNSSSVCNQLGAFINETTAQSGKKLTVAQANQLIAAAQQIRAVIGCQ